MTHPLRFYLICAASRRDSLNDFFYTLDSDPNAGDSLTVPLSQNGKAPATHWGMNWAATEAQVAALDAYLVANPALADDVTLIAWETASGKEDSQKPMKGRKQKVNNPRHEKQFIFRDWLGELKLKVIKPE